MVDVNGDVGTKAHIYKSIHDYGSELDVTVGGSGTYKGVEGTASLSYQQIEETTEKSYKFYTSAAYKATVMTGQLRAPDALQLSTDAQTAIDNIDKTTMRGYLDFISNFGTHYFDSADFGGKLQITREISKSVLKKHTEQNIQATVGAELADFGIDVEVGHKDHDTQTSIENHSTKYLQSKGGDANLFEKGDVKQWPDTVKDNPTIMAGSVKPIYGLIRDATHKSNMEKAVGQHILRVRAEALRQEHQSNSNRDEINSEVDAMMRKDLVTDEDLKHIKMLTGNSS